MLNRVTLQGRMVADPELKQTKNGVDYCNFRIAVDRNYVDKESGEREADFFNVTAWRGRGKFVADYFHKGELIVIDGVLQSRNYTDKDGNKRTAISIQAENIQFGESKRSKENATAVASETEIDETEINNDEELPF